MVDVSGAPLRSEDFAATVTAMFDTADHAETARQDLIAAGISAGAISVIGDNASPLSTGTEPAALQSGSFWETMKELFMPEEDRNQFAEGVRRGGVTVAVRTDTANHDRVIDILDRDGAVDLDERQDHWRTDGWTGYTGQDPLADAKAPAVTLDPDSLDPDNEDMAYEPASAATAGFGASEADRFPVGEDIAPPVESPGALPTSSLLATSDEPKAEPVSGTRDLSHGRTRIRSYLWPMDQDAPPTHP